MKRNWILIIFCIGFIAFTGCNNSDNQINKDNVEYSFQGKYSSGGYNFSLDGIGISGERFLYSGWENITFDYTCTDLTCEHKTDICTALAPVNYDISRSMYIYHNDKMIIMETYE